MQVKNFTWALYTAWSQSKHEIVHLIRSYLKTWNGAPQDLLFRFVCLWSILEQTPTTVFHWRLQWIFSAGLKGVTFKQQQSLGCWIPAVRKSKVKGRILITGSDSWLSGKPITHPSGLDGFGAETERSDTRKPGFPVDFPLNPIHWS